MKINEKSGLVIFAKSFLTGLVLFAALNIVFIILGTIFQASPEKRFATYNFSQIMLLSFLMSLLTLPNYLHIAKAIRMDNKTLYTEMIIRALEKQKWEIESLEEAKMVFISSFRFPTWREKIVIRFTDTELQISGPREYVERTITLSNFPYGAFEISTFD